MISGLNKWKSESQSFWLRAELILLALSLFLMPWQLRHTFYFAQEGGLYFEYASLHIYAGQIVILAMLVCWLIRTKWRPVVIVPSWALVAVIAWMGLTSLWALNSGVAFYNFLNWVLGLMWMIYVFSTKPSFETIARPFVWGVTFQAGIGILQFLLNDSVGLKFLGESILNPEIRGVPVVQTESVRQLRAHGLLPHANAFGGFMMLGLILLVSQGKAGIGLAMQGVAWILAFARGAWMGAVAALLTLALAIPHKAARPLVGLGIIAVMMIGLLNPFVSNRLAVDGDLERMSIEERVEGLQVWQEVVRDRWLAGVGLGNYPLELAREDPGQLAWAYQPVHNAFLLHGAELGVVGMVLFLWLAWEVIRKFLRDGLNVGHLLVLSLWVVGMVDHWPITLEQGRMAVFLALVLTFLGYEVLWPKSKRL